jgi:hypothetical protein
MLYRTRHSTSVFPNCDLVKKLSNATDCTQHVFNVKICLMRFHAVSTLLIKFRRVKSHRYTQRSFLNSLIYVKDLMLYKAGFYCTQHALRDPTMVADVLSTSYSLSHALIKVIWCSTELTAGPGV